MPLSIFWLILLAGIAIYLLKRKRTGLVFGFFRLSGQSPIPAPTNHIVKSDQKNGITYWGPASSNITMMEYAMHEILGLVYARLFYRGITDVKSEE